jgi:predicted RNA-binding protein with PUA-like domain
MAYFLVKSEPVKYPWSKMLADGRTFWDGVRNYQASNNLKAMKIGDQAFFYHSNEGLEIVGIVEVVKEYYPDHTDPSGKFGMVDFKSVASLERPVTLAEIKADPKLQEIGLVRQSRLSVMPIDKASWDHILELGQGVK